MRAEDIVAPCRLIAPPIFSPNMFRFLPFLTAVTVLMRIGSTQDFPDEANIKLWTCDGSDGQKWELMNDTTIRLVSDLKCVDISNYGTTDGSNIWLFTCHTSDKTPSHQNQEWSFNSNGTITSLMSGLCIGTNEGDVEPGSNVELRICTGASNQKWSFSMSDGTLKVGDFCMDVGSKASCQEDPWKTYPYCDPNLPTTTRAMDLVNRMTIVEKVTQMISDKDGVPRLGVPPFGHTECTHGTLNDGTILTTLFPQALSFARSFDRNLVHSIARAISDEVRAKHNTANAENKYDYPYGLICWAPVLNICRDPRWGRCQEGYGEDPYLQAECARQYVQGLQYGPDKKHVEAIATCKHFDVHTGPEDIPVSRFSFDAIVSYRDWIETFQPAFQACGAAGAMSYMCSYNAINGVPACANRELLGDILRGEWNFTGFVVSDCGAIGNVFSQHKFASSAEEASEFCVKAGCDWNCGNTYGNLLAVLNEGLITEDMIDTSVVRLMEGFISLGVLDPPDSVPYNSLNMSVVKEHEKLNQLAAQESMVLLKNDGILPLNVSAIKSVALIGPCADEPECNTGDYNPQPAYIITPRSAFVNRSGLTVNYASGCADVQCTSNSGFALAVETAKNSDFVIYVGGISHAIEGEGHDRSNISLPGLQSDLITMLVQVGKPVVVVLCHGAPVVSPVYADVNAVLSAGYAGQEAGNAVYDVLTGVYNPAGRTVVTWYTGNSQLPPMTNYSMVNRTYRYMTATPQYKFGYGLSYTKFNYSNLELSPQTDIKPCDSLEIKVSVTNIGPYVGSEVVQFYTNFTNSPVTTSLIKLVGFERVENLTPGSQQVVSVSMTPSQMTVIYNYGNVPMIVPGVYQIYSGGSQPKDQNAPSNILSSSFTITGDPIPLSQCT